MGFMQSRVNVIDNPLAQYYLAVLRDKNTGSSVFREVLERIGFILGYEISRDLAWKTREVETPLAKAIGYFPSGKLLVVGVLGASIPLINGIVKALPWAGIGLIAAKRVETSGGVRVAIYYERLPISLARYEKIILADPMLATGKTIEASIKHLRQRGARSIIVTSVIASRPGIEYLLGHVADIKIYTVGIDPVLNDKFFIVPGLGDAGDRGLGVDLFI